MKAEYEDLIILSCYCIAAIFLMFLYMTIMYFYKRRQLKEEKDASDFAYNFKKRIEQHEKYKKVSKIYDGIIQRKLKRERKVNELKGKKDEPSDSNI
jgi:hypothetical protein